jgi:NAD(P)-dependent dehydrogenase (short-subunit alcohol dehydrogenase family)
MCSGLHGCAAEKSRHAGCVIQAINVGSLAGLSSIPFLGIYSASKFALEGYTEALRHEVKPFNIQVSLTEADFLKTPMINHRQIAANRITEYDPWRQRPLDAIRADEEKAERNIRLDYGLHIGKASGEPVQVWIAPLVLLTLPAISYATRPLSRRLTGACPQ